MVTRASAPPPTVAPAVKAPARYWTNPRTAGPDGLVGVGGDLRPATLLLAYREGVFPWFNPSDPILWWSPDPRGIFELDGVHVSKSLARTLKSGKFRVTVNAAFREVVLGCATGRDQGTWITARMVEAYAELHRLGRALSVETWLPDPEATSVGGGWRLAGGIYGVTVGGLFAGESMFHRSPDASKVALVSLAEKLRAAGYTLFDTQMVTEHTGRMGAVEIPRREYLDRLAEAVGRAPGALDPRGGVG